ncbi:MULTISPECIES: hypothetical protein [unclassified Mesorhizobium]|uniref:hypothetical protein n=1 Tax=unclassified Mesorhizobium TaxID=325217 RepID=UPI000BAFADFA|nr:MULTISPECIES: hypothetical protein [unclassified Mesorhizobium]PBB29967.1 hypothetical protein CK214_22910 [Mesorhizobium sp. WSM3882]RUV06788.1 hypothetical protein EOA79_07435 [Mesorhizobium sp. M1A.F.Ca.IN.020.03.2.1]RUV86592.1 hypothetical protein EOA51_14250 [Mesorhizobium sp. M1A.F.Ca.IN.020.32.1.1]RUW02670.1 hypothetical protein EOA49_05885 [Mesorhizobium sp. M1A.F.Ca.IN.020.04.1.1]RUW13728.1 hypothetical protein EOA53_08050 [Mesorhizobium sp. M1A.F.Ca.IN.020.03.1.1]
MPLQNRVDPFGVIHAVPERGLFTGNRGIVHDPETKTLLRKRWALPAWIICVCQFRGVRREPMGRNRPGGKAGWTELFFLDEVTALAAGHRPCFYCRRDQARDFVRRFGKVFGIAEPRAPMVDKRLHKERLASGGRPPTVSSDELAGLPDGAVVAEGETAYALRASKALEWSFAGYAEPVLFNRLAGRSLRLLTPATSVSVLRHGYAPVWHPSADT